MVSIQKLDFRKSKANKHVTVAFGVLSSIVNLDVPTAAELNAMQKASVSISWNDWDFGMQASEQSNDPSLADAANYQSRGVSNFGGSISMYLPKKYDDASNNHSLVFDMTDKPGKDLIIAVRVDGETPTTAPFANGDYVSLYVVQTDAMTNSMTGADDIRRTVSFLNQGQFAHYTVVGPHVITAVPATVSGSVAAPTSRGRVKAKVGGRDYTNKLEYTTSTPNLIEVWPGGYYRLKAAGAANITITDPGAGTTASVAVTVTA